MTSKGQLESEGQGGHLLEEGILIGGPPKEPSPQRDSQTPIGLKVFLEYLLPWTSYHLPILTYYPRLIIAFELEGNFQMI